MRSFFTMAPSYRARPARRVPWTGGRAPREARAVPGPLDGPDPPLDRTGALEVDGASLHLRRWIPPAGRSVRAPVALVHGFGEHVGRHDLLARDLAARGHEVVACDQRGHGRSPGPRVLLEDLETALDDLDALVRAARGDGGAAGPPVLFGHSMGGAFAAAYAATRPGRVRALVLSGPAVHLPLLPRARTAPARLLAHVAPRTPVARISPARLSRDPEEVQAFVRDPLCWHGRVPVATASTMHGAGALALDEARALSIPLLVVHGERDTVVPVVASRILVASVASGDRELVETEHGAHEPLHDLCRDEVLRLVGDWVDAH